MVLLFLEEVSMKIFPTFLGYILCDRVKVPLEIQDTMNDCEMT